MWILIILILINAPKWAFVLWAITFLFKLVDVYFTGLTRKEVRERIKNRLDKLMKMYGNK